MLVATHTGCEYLLAGSDGVVTSSTIMGDKYNMQKITNIRDYNVVVAYDVDNILVHNGSFDVSRGVASIPTTG